MLDTQTKKRIDDCRDILVGKLPDPKAQIEQITIGLIYKFMDDMDKEAIELGGKAKFFASYTLPNPEFPNDRTKDITVPFEQYGWDNLFHAKVTATDMLRLYSEAIAGMDKNPNIPQLFRDIFKNAFLPYRDPETLKLFLKTIGGFTYTHSEKLGDAFEYLLSVMGSQGDAGQFRTPRHIIDFVVKVVNPNKTDKILDPACGTAGFLISAFKHIQKTNEKGLTPDDRKRLIQNFVGYDISPDMVRLSLVNLYLHGFSDPHIWEYDTLSSEERWDETYDVILANPPFMSPKGGIRPHKKFSISSNRSEVLFVDYIAEHLNNKGRAGIIVPEGVIFQSGSAYKDVRKMLVENYLYAVVSLPAGVFNPYSGVKTSVLLMDKEFAKKSNEILFVKIDNDGYGLGAQRNVVKGGQLEEAVELLQQFREGELFESKMAHAVAKKEIEKNGDYNLSGERYKNFKATNSSYNLVELSDEKIFKIVSGGTPSSEIDKYWNGNINWATLVDLPQTEFISIITDTARKITEEGLKNSSAKLLPINSILVSTRATIGRIAINKIECCTNQGSKNIIINDFEKANTVFVALMMTQLIDKMNSMSTGGTFKELSTSSFRTLQIPLPPLSIQEEIVAEIEGYQKIIHGAKAVVENYKPKIDIEPDWKLLKLGDISEFKNGLNFSKESSGEQIKILGVSHFKDKLIAPLHEIQTTQVNDSISDNYLLKKGDIVFVRSNGNKELVGRSLIIPDVHERISFSGFTIRCRLKEGIEPLFIGYLLKSDFHNKLMKNQGRGANITNLSQELLNDILIPIPPIETQLEIIAQLEKEQALINANKELIQIFEQKIKDRIAKVWGAEKEQKSYAVREEALSLVAEG